MTRRRGEARELTKLQDTGSEQEYLKWFVSQFLCLKKINSNQTSK